MTARWIHTGFAQQLVFGDKSLRQLGPLLRSLGVRRAMLVTSEGRAASSEGEEVIRRVGRALESTFTGAAPHVPAPVVQAAMMQARRDGVDGVVSLGGGSCVDLGKAVCFFTEQEAGTPGSSFADRPALPHIAVPTTYSGAEVTPFFGMTDPNTRQKGGAGGPTIAPLVAIYDPAMTATMPPGVRAETGMNALAHCVELCWSPSRTPEAEAVAFSGIERIVDALPATVANPGEDEAARRMLEGAALAGRSLQNGSMGVHHGLAQLLGGRTGISHGLANALLLPSSIRFNQDHIPDEVERVGEALGDAADAAGVVDGLRATLGITGGLSDVGVTDDDIEAVARMSQASPSVKANPRPVAEADARAILEAAF